MRLNFQSARRRLKYSETGVTAVEFALVVPIIIFTIMSVLQIGIAAWAKSTLEISMREAARFAVTGMDDPDSGVTRNLAILEKVKQDMTTFPLAPSRNITLTTKVYPSFEDIGRPEPEDNNNGVCDAGESYTDTNGNGRFDADAARTGFGNANDVVIYEVTFPMNTVIPVVGDMLRNAGFFTLKSSAAVQNEPFGAATVNPLVLPC
jgi:Flp pilus assembly pilin Flp